MKNTFSSYGLLFGCPLKSEKFDCPLIDLRKLPILERIQALNNKSEKELMELEQHHKKCLQEREKVAKIKKP